MFKTGDIVMLKSGGPLMTVSEDSGKASEVLCIWFVGAKELHQAFAAVSIDKVDVSPEQAQKMWLHASIAHGPATD